MEVVEKIREVGDSYELSKCKAISRTLELDAKLAEERLNGAQVRIVKLTEANEKLAKHLHALQTDKQRLLRELKLSRACVAQLTEKARRQASTLAATVARKNRQMRRLSARSATSRIVARLFPSIGGGNRLLVPERSEQQQQQQRLASTASLPDLTKTTSNSEELPQAQSRARAIIEELRKRFSRSNLANKRPIAQLKESSAQTSVDKTNTSIPQINTASTFQQQTEQSFSSNVSMSTQVAKKLREIGQQTYASFASPEMESLTLERLRSWRSISLDDVRPTSRLVISCGWPTTKLQKRSAQSPQKLRHRLTTTNNISQQKQHHRLSERQKQELLVEYLRKLSGNLESQVLPIESSYSEVESALKIRRQKRRRRPSQFASVRKTHLVSYELPVVSPLSRAIALPLDRTD